MNEIESIAKGLINGMEFLHFKKVVHRDLKSANVLLKNSSFPIICDFGMSRMIEQSQTMSTFDIGSICWSAPEILRGTN